MISHHKKEGYVNMIKQKIIDIANIAGVSPATVSNALNGRKGVSERTKETIRKVAREIGYSKDSAISPVQKVIKLVVFKKHGYVVSDTPFFASLIEGSERECRLLGYELLITHINSNESSYQQLIGNTNFASLSGVLLLATEMNTEDMILFENIGVPIVVLDGSFSGNSFSSVLTNSVDAAYKAVKYLIENGHVNIGYLHSSIYINNFHDRERGYQQALEEYGIKPDKKFKMLLEPTMDGSYRDMKTSLSKAQKDLPTAFFADNDIIACGVMRALKEEGVKIPQEVSIIGFDDMPFCEITNPRLTTIKVFKQEMGSIAVKRLNQIIQGQRSISQKIELGTELVPRDSVSRLIK